ncbi:UDP-N-Acetylglucosamine 2-epimerase [Bellilinea caldifistulae]|uniref:UDP-N-acetylglucosamine 2-epimerase (non-hydrolyzing) n=1 Tax=Bellilinea caldifistulae TaxID=360411 RepID=A0A0N8GMI2_9CHLR|nr:UDP-N-acetylglucosamine 2-epimerase (non-hydrolyzing) [Bellilinea caldifistulae]KPL75370.1 UDP-N-acetylglucosamine 2-epimerase [Bellilinea caldifistulae]GAP09798.1 UDP-N-Acetylglucosamine 2-epimerase [Bellilinea caldifistulae]
MTRKLRVVSIFGTRPEAVKMAPVVQALARTPEIDSRVIVTAQHRQMLDQVLDLFGIRPDYDLNLMQPNQTLAQLTAAIFTHLDPVLRHLQPDWMLVQGDTTTVMAAALLGYYQRIKVGHVEAGLRSGDRWQPFPEEVNRRVASVVADLHLAPTRHSRQNLLREGVEEWRIVVTGNPVIDALNEIVRRPMPAEAGQILDRYQIGRQGRQLVLVTAHRRENFGEPLEAICCALKQLSERYKDKIQIIYPVHLNPNVQEPVYRLLDGVANIALLPPLEYLTMVHLLQAARLVLTDSGGIQEEATGLGKPTLVLRNTTERPEGVEAGVLKLVGWQTERIVAEASRLLEDENAYQAMVKAENPFGDGRAAERIVDAVLNFLEPRGR